MLKCALFGTASKPRPQAQSYRVITMNMVFRCVGWEQLITIRIYL